MVWCLLAIKMVGLATWGICVTLCLVNYGFQLKDRFKKVTLVDSPEPACVTVQQLIDAPDKVQTPAKYMPEYATPTSHPMPSRYIGTPMATRGMLGIDKTTITDILGTMGNYVIKTCARCGEIRDADNREPHECWQPNPPSYLDSPEVRARNIARQLNEDGKAISDRCNAERDRVIFDT
jgi:hypothetical protein